MRKLTRQLNPQLRPRERGAYISTGLSALVLIFIFQQFSYATFLFEDLLNLELGNSWKYFLNKTLRFLLNDLAVILMIYGIFYERKYVDLALWVVCFGFVFILLPYIFLVINYPEYNGPLYSHLHRLSMNPILLLLLIPVLLYQKMNLSKQI